MTLEENLQNMKTRKLWYSVKTMTNMKSTKKRLNSVDKLSTANELNSFYEKVWYTRLLIWMQQCFGKHTVPSKSIGTARQTPSPLLFTEDTWVQDQKMSTRQEPRMSAPISWYSHPDVPNNSGHITVCITPQHFYMSKSKGTNNLEVNNI